MVRPITSCLLAVVVALATTLPTPGYREEANLLTSIGLGHLTSRWRWSIWRTLTSPSSPHLVTTHFLASPPPLPPSPPPPPPPPMPPPPSPLTPPPPAR